MPRRWAAGALLVATLAACAAPVTPSRPGAGAGATPAAAFGAEPGAAFAQEREERRRGIGIPPSLPTPRAVDQVAGTLRASRPVPGTGPVAGPPPAVPGNALSRLSALPASPLANPPGGFGLGRP
jgi:hypothetical protein